MWTSDGAESPQLDAPLAERVEERRVVLREAPHARALREELHRLRPDLLRVVEGALDAARAVGAEDHVTTLAEHAFAARPSRPARRAGLPPPLHSDDDHLRGRPAGGDRARLRRARLRLRDDLGVVLAARQIVEAAVLLAGGVLSDRLPRNLVLVGASLVQAGAQAITAGLVLTGTATVLSLPRCRRSTASVAGWSFPPRSGSSRRPSARSGCRRRTRSRGCRGTLSASSARPRRADRRRGQPRLGARDRRGLVPRLRRAAGADPGAAPRAGRRAAELRLREGGGVRWRRGCGRRGVFGLGTSSAAAGRCSGRRSRRTARRRGAWATILTAGGFGRSRRPDRVRYRPERPLVVCIAHAAAVRAPVRGPRARRAPSG